MKKKILSLILCLVIFTGIFAFSACKKEDVYNLDNLSEDYYAIATDCKYVKNEEGQLQFDYSSFKFEGENYFENIMNTVKPYTFIKDYNTIVYNMLKFSSSYVDRCSDNDINATGDLKNTLKSNLDELKKAFEKVDVQISSLGNNLYFWIGTQDGQQEMTQKTSLTNLQYFLNSYDELVTTVYNFNVSLSRLYFKYAVSNSNPIFEESEFTEENAFSLIGLLDQRIKFQINNLSYAYYQTALRLAFPKQMVEEGTECAGLTNFGAYSATITELSKYDLVSNPQTYVDNLKNSDKLETFFQKATKLHNIQSALESDYEKYVYACSQIDYYVVVHDDNASERDQLYVNIIDDYDSLIGENTSAIIDMLNTLS